MKKSLMRFGLAAGAFFLISSSSHALCYRVWVSKAHNNGQVRMHQEVTNEGPDTCVDAHIYGQAAEVWIYTEYVASEKRWDRTKG